MAFCNSCGAALNEGTKFCNKCGAAAAGNPSGMSAPVTRPAQPPLPAPPPSKGSSSALKVILMIVGGIVLIGVLGMVTCGIVVHRAIKNAKVNQSGGNVKVETPFGNVETSRDPDAVVKELGVEVYPGAEPLKDMTSSATFGNVHTATAFFNSDDSADKVCTFYKAQLPTANVTTSDQNRCTIVSSASPMITINIESSGSGSKIQISSVSKKAASN